MRAIAAALLFLATAAPVDAADAELSQSAFRDRLAATISTTTGRPIEKVDARTFKTKATDGTELTISIDNAYAEYQSEPARLDAIIVKYARLVNTTTDRVEDGVDQLVVIVRPSDYLTRSVPAGAKLQGILRERPLAGDLSLFLAVDGAGTIRTATTDDLARWKLEEATAWTRAIANIRQHVGAVALVKLGDKNGPSGITAESGLAPSLLADPGFCGGKAADGMEGLLALLYSRDAFLYADPRDGAQVKQFWKAVKKMIASNGALSSTPMTCHDGHWVATNAP